MKPRSVRALAARALAPVLAGKASLSSTLPVAQSACAPRDRALLQNLLLGTCREWLYLDALLKPLLQSAPKDPAVLALLGLGVFQLLRTRIPPHAAIAETVEAARELGFPKATGLINALLRRFQREQDELLARAAPLAHAHPDWLCKRLRTDWPDRLDAILDANNRPAPLTLRVNTRQISREDYLARLQAADVAATPCAHSTDGLRLAEYRDITTLPGYEEGLFSVQDEIAQLAARLLAPAPGSRVLDACAAPGGKTAHLLETAPDIHLTAVDQDGARVMRIRENLSRLQLDQDDVTILTGDAAQPQAWAGDAVYDAILLDAPCTATGVIRRHPDIKLLRKPSDVAQTMRLQAAILDALWPRLAAGGRLLYATCSVLKEENERQIGAFLKRTADAREIVLAGPWGDARPYGRQCFPEPDGGDGFYYALLEKVSA